MGRVLFLLLALPWWAYFPMAGGIAWFGERAQPLRLADQQDRAEVFPSAPSGPIDIAGANVVLGGNPDQQVTLRGWINPDLSRNLVRLDDSEAGAPVSVHLLFGENDPAGTEMVRGALVLRETERAAVDEMLAAFPFDADRPGYIFEINGLMHRALPDAARIRHAIVEQGLRAAPDFVFFTPVLNGRAAALAPIEDDRGPRALFWTIAAVVAFLGVAKRVLSVLCVGPDCNRAEAPATIGSAENLPDAAETRGPEGRVRGVALQDDSGPRGGPEKSGASGPAGPDQNDLYYYAGLASAMLFVGTLSYDPVLALRLFGVLTLLFLVVRFSVRLLRRKVLRRAERAV